MCVAMIMSAAIGAVEGKDPPAPYSVCGLHTHVTFKPTKPPNPTEMSAKGHL